MVSDRLLAIDIGTTRLKAIVFAPDGTVIAEASRPTPAAAPAPELAEIELADLWQTLSATVADLGAARKTVRAIGVVGQLALVVVDKRGEPLLRAISWSDRRAQGEAEELAATGHHDFHAVSGRPMTPELVPPRLLWLKRNRPDLWPHVARLLSLKDWVVARLTGVFVTDEAHASYSGLFDVQQRRWSDSLCALADVAATQLPPTRPASAVAGGLTAEAATALGLTVGLDVAVGASDGTAGAVGAGATRSGVAVDIAGTTDVVLVTLPEPSPDPKGVAILNAHAVPGLWTVGGPTGLTGGAVTWVARTLGYASVAEAKAALAEQLRTVAPGCGGLFFRPTLTGSRFPDWRASERGTIAGLTLAHGPADILRAGEEGAAYTVREALATLQRRSIGLSEIIVVGGLANDPAALQLRADVLGMPLLTPLHAEASAVGAAMFAGVAAGILPDMTAATAALVRYTTRYMPDAERHKDFTAAQEGWLKIKDKL